MKANNIEKTTETTAIGITASILIAIKLILWGCAVWQAIHLQWLGVIGLILFGDFLGYIGKRVFEKYEEIKTLPQDLD